MSVYHRNGPTEQARPISDTPESIRIAAIAIRESGRTVHITIGHAGNAPALCGQQSSMNDAAIELDIIRDYAGAFEDIVFHPECLRAIR